MKASTWSRIYQHLDNQQWTISHTRGVDRSGVSPGIAIKGDDLAQQGQRLERIKSRVGLHFCRARDRETVMKIPPWPWGHLYRREAS